MLDRLLREGGERWLESWEQAELPVEYPRMPRPVWLYLSLVAEHRRLLHRNGMGVAQHMTFLREAFGVKGPEGCAVCTGDICLHLDAIRKANSHD